MFQRLWSDSLDPKFTKRLLRPSVQPGVINRRLVNSIFARSQWFNSRLSLLNHLNRRQSGESILADPVPIVYAQPLQPAGTTSVTSLLTNERTVVQAKFIDSTSFSGLNPTQVVDSTPIVNSTPVVHSTSVLVDSTADGQDLDVSQPLSNTPPLAPPQPDRAIAAAPMPMIQVQSPEFVVTRHSDTTSKRAPRQRAHRIPPLPPLQRLPNRVETTAVAETILPTETTAAVQMQRTIDREPAISQPAQPPQNFSEPVALVYAQPVSGKSNPSLSAVTPALQVVQPLVVPYDEPSDRPMVYSYPPVSSRVADQVMLDSSAASRAIATSPLMPNSTQPNSFEAGQEFNRASTPTSQPVVSHHQRPLPSQPSVAAQPAAIDLNALTEKIQRKLLRQLTVESERRGHSSWR